MVRLKRTVDRAAEMILEWRADGQLWLRSSGREEPVRVHRCFPWSEPGRFISLRNAENKEVAMVSDLRKLSPGSREALEAALLEAGFVLRIRQILRVDEEVEIRTWQVVTEQGPRSFQTKLDDWPVEVPGGGIVIRDVSGDLYHVPDPEGMDERSRGWLWAFVG
jgi:hypothetical protein